MKESGDYTEGDITRLIANRRFLAAVHAYSMNMFSLGEAVTLAAEDRPYVPRNMSILAYDKAVQEVAERISAGKIQVSGALQQEFPDVYRSHDEASDHYGRRRLRFSELLDPALKKEAFQLYREEFNDTDIQEIIRDQRALAAIDAYQTTLTLGRLKTLLYGDLNAHPHDLSFDAFRRLCHAVVERIRGGEISVPTDLRVQFPEIYAPEN
jgi:hypothetical protein